MHARFGHEGRPRGPGRLAALALAAALGCGGGTSNGTEGESETGTTGEALAIDEFFVAAEQAYCAWAVRCGGFVDETSCAAANFFDEIYPRGLLASAQLQPGEDGMAVKYVQASHAAGRIEFDADAARTCLDYVAARGCVEPHTYAPSEDEKAGREACGKVFRGTTVLNGPCLLSVECAPQDDGQAVCGFDPSCAGDPCCVGGCRVLGSVPIGTPCTSQTRCEPGSYCARDPNTNMFTVCSAQKQIGASCSRPNECKEGAYCDQNAGVCKALAGVGQACQDFGDGGCEPGLYCADPNWTGNAKCYAYGELGDACPGNWWEDGCNAFNTGCSESADKCIALPTAGQPCAQTNQDRCAPTARCDWQTDRCVALAGEGEPCDSNWQCAGALYCDGWDPSTARCRAPEVTTVCAVPAADALPEGT